MSSSSRVPSSTETPSRHLHDSGPLTDCDTSTPPATYPSAVPGKFEIISNLFAPFSHRKTDSTRILAELAPVIMTPRMINAAASSSQRHDRPVRVSQQLDFAALGRTPMHFNLGSRRITSRDLQVAEAAPELLQEDVPDPEGIASDVSLLRGFKATIPSANRGKLRRRQVRNVDVGSLSLSQRPDSQDPAGKVTSVGSKTIEDTVTPLGNKPGKWKASRRGRTSLRASKSLGKDELKRQTDEILRDKENIHVRRTLINSEISEITHKIAALNAIRTRLEQDLVKLREDELELADELEGVREREIIEQGLLGLTVGNVLPLSNTSRRWRGLAFLPSEHHELPPGVAFMTLSSHMAPITALDLNEPYGVLVTASQDKSARLWDLCSGEEVGKLRGHLGTVKCLQVEGQLCLTGGTDATVRIWDLEGSGDEVSCIDKAAQDSGSPRHVGRNDEASGNYVACIRLLEGHSKPVSSLFFEGNVLVTGASDKTIRQWDMNTGQCVLAMDIIWAMAHPASIQSFYSPLNSSDIPAVLTKTLPATGGFLSTPKDVDNNSETHEDFVGGLQIVYEGLISGSGDGVVRMWDMRTGSVSRTLIGHAGPVTCVACDIDTYQIVSGGLDRTIKIWDIRTGGYVETLKYDHGVTSLQFDTRKIVSCTGENGVNIYNRITMQHSILTTNGHTSPVEKVRYMDTYMVSGGRDATVKLWAI